MHNEWSVCELDPNRRGAGWVAGQVLVLHVIRAARQRCFRCACFHKSSATLSYLAFVHPLSKKICEINQILKYEENTPLV